MVMALPMPVLVRDGGGRLMTRVCATAAVQLDPDVISRRKSVPRSFGLVPFPRAHRYTGITKREVIPFGARKEIRPSYFTFVFYGALLRIACHSARD